MRYLGIDYGTKRTGLALSDENGTIGFPHAILPTKPTLLETLKALVVREQVGAIVIGKSETLAGADNPIAAAAARLGEALHAATHVPVYFESEVYTSVEARRPPQKMPKTRAPAKRAAVDAAAAALILNSYLERHRAS